MLSLASSLISCLIAFVDYYVCEEGMEEVEFSKAEACDDLATFEKD